MGGSGGGGDPGHEPPNGADLVAEIQAWSSNRTTAEAARARTRERWLRQQAAEMATIVGLLADLAQSAGSVQVRTAHGEWRGAIAGASAELCHLRCSSDSRVVVVNRHITSLTTGGRAAIAAGTETPHGPMALDLGTALGELAGQQSEVRMVLVEDRATTGRVTAAGEEVVTLRTQTGHLYVRISAIEAWQHL